MAVFRRFLSFSGIFAIFVFYREVESHGGFVPPLPPHDCTIRRRRSQLSGAFCDVEGSQCNNCGAVPKPTEPDGEVDASGALEALAQGGLIVLRSEFFDSAVHILGAVSGWATVGAGIFDGVLGIVDATKGKDKSAWNRYKLESFISQSTDYVVCEIKAVVGEYFAKYMGNQDLCHYNMGVNAMAAVWSASCGSRQCLNLTNLPADRRGDCCTAGNNAGNDKDCDSWSDEQILAGQGVCRLQGELFLPGSGVCSTLRVCKSCMSFDKAIEMTQAQIDSYATYPTNWGEALRGYSNVDALIAMARGTMMMLAFYQESVLLGAQASLRNYQLYAKDSYAEMQSRLDSLISSAPSVVEDSSCTLSTPPQIDKGNKCVWKIPDFCIFTRMGCSRPYSMVGMNGCVTLDAEFCGHHQNCSVCTSMRGCSRLACYDDCNDNGQSPGCGSMWEQVRQEEHQKATEVLKSLYVESLSSVQRFLDVIKNYSQEPLPMQVFGAYRRLGYRMPSCEASTTPRSDLSECQHLHAQTMGPGLPHSQLHP